jgi:GxxExxY protein
MDANSRRSDLLTRTIIGCAYECANGLGHGFIEKVYANALLTELRLRQIQATSQHPIKVFYKGCMVGEFYADLLVENDVLVEVKAVQKLTNLHLAQCLNYLKASELRLCLLLNFGRKVEVRRVVNNF